MESLSLPQPIRGLEGSQTLFATLVHLPGGPLSEVSSPFRIPFLTGQGQMVLSLVSTLTSSLLNSLHYSTRGGVGVRRKDYTSQHPLQLGFGHVTQS